MGSARFFRRACPDDACHRCISLAQKLSRAHRREWCACQSGCDLRLSAIHSPPCSGSLLRYLRDRFADTFVGSAAAEIATHMLANLVGGRRRDRIEHGFTGDNKTWSAKSALRSVVVDESLLDGVQLPFRHDG